MADRPPSAAISRQLTVSVAGDGADRFDRAAFGTVGVYDIDWLTQPRFTRLLDNLAASPGAFAGVRVFGALSAGKREALAPADGGTVWPSPDAPIDFAPSFAALEALSKRGLTPFVSLGFFPQAVSPSPIAPPAEWTTWKTLVRTFLQQLAADPRFGPKAIRGWWFEVWNEPNEGRFWSGTPDDYLAFYRATSAAVAESGVAVRLGGPAIAYKPQVDPASGAPWLERFLRFVAADSSLQCDFVSFHRKGTVGDDPPDPRRLWDAAIATAELAQSIDPVRFTGLTIIDDEADEKVGFEVPYAPRLDHRNAAWLGAVAAMHAALGPRYAAARFRFLAAADNADLQLVQAPFDGRRSLMTLARPSVETDLLKLPAYAFYELLRLHGDRAARVTEGAESLFPATDLYALATFDADRVAVQLIYYLDPVDPTPQPRTVDLVVRDLPWPRANVACFQINRTHSNGYTVAGGSDANPFPVPDPSRLPVIREAQELALARPITHDGPIESGVYRETLALDPFTTICLWLTPASDAIPPAPDWLEVTTSDGNALLRWGPNRDPSFFSYEVWDCHKGVPTARLSPFPLRSALWIDTAPLTPRTYAVRTVTASGVSGDFVTGRGMGDDSG